MKKGRNGNTRAKWQMGEMGRGQNGKRAKRENGEMAIGRNGKGRSGKGRNGNKPLKQCHHRVLAGRGKIINKFLHRKS
jgi:hypothetical protein